MGIFELMRVALSSLIHHALRSLLTILGVVFGVGAVIAMLSVGEGAKEESLKQFQQLGVNNIIVKPIKPKKSEEIKRQERTERLFHPGTEEEAPPDVIQKRPHLISIDDVQALRAMLPNKILVCSLKKVDARLQQLGKDDKTEIWGVSAALPRIRDLEIDIGRFISDVDVRKASRVCVLGADARKKLFKFQNPLNQMIKIKGMWFTVIGVIGRAALQQDSTFTSDINNQIFVPLSTATVLLSEFFPREIDAVYINVPDIAMVYQVSTLVDKAFYRLQMEGKKHNNGDKKRNYEITVPLQLLEQRSKMLFIYNIVLSSIAGISLLVGGIGIMNIMLASVTERTREIGIRRALGATRWDIAKQFTVEAVFLSVLGGVLGVGLGILLGKSIERYADMHTIISPISIIIAFAVAALVGVVFGVYPALKAAWMAPIEALRHE